MDFLLTKKFIRLMLNRRMSSKSRIWCYKKEMNSLIKKLCNTLMVYVAMVIVTFSLLVTQANPTFLQSNLLSKRLFAYNLLNNFSNVITGVLLILMGYQIKGNIKFIKKYIYLYSKLIDIYRTIFVD